MIKAELSEKSGISFSYAPMRLWSLGVLSPNVTVFGVKYTGKFLEEAREMGGYRNSPASVFEVCSLYCVSSLLVIFLIIEK